MYKIFLSKFVESLSHPQMGGALDRIKSSEPTKVASDGCTKCSNPDVSSETSDVTNSEVSILNHCQSCGNSWYDVYKFAYVEPVSVTILHTTNKQ